MTVKVCLPGLVQQGKISQDMADEAGQLFDELQQDFRRQFNDQVADSMASDATLRELERRASRKRFLAARTIQARQRIEMDMSGYGGGREGGNGGAAGGGGNRGGSGEGGPIDPRSGPAFLAGDDRASYSNVEGRQRAVRARAHAMIDRILADHSTNVIGQMRNRAQLDDIVRELFGEDSGNLAAKEMAEAWTASAEMLRQRFNAAGGDVGKLERWGLPQSHDSEAVRAAGYDAWRAEIAPRLDREAMIDERTGLPFTDQALELVLQDSFEKIRTDGWSARTPGGAGGGSLANRRGDARFFVFRSADDWMAYAGRFGAGNAFDAMMGHIDGMSRDIAMMEILGPNPENTLRWVKDSLVQSAQLDRAPGTDAVARAEAAGMQMDRIFGELTGATQRPESRWLALAFSSLRSIQTAAKLGSAMLSAVTDLAFQRSTRAFNGLPQARMLVDYARLFLPGSAADQKLAVRLGLIAEEWSQRTAGQNRYLGEELTGEVSRRLAEGVLRLSGLNRWTQAGRWAFGMEMLGHVTDQRGKAFGELDPPFRGLLERYGFNAGDWDHIRTSPLEVDRGVEWLKPGNVENRQLGDRLLEMIQRETDFAVPTADVRTRATLHSAARRGTWFGEVVRSAALFKSFGISILMMQGHRAMAQAGASRARYVGGLVINTTVMGALALVLKDLAAGRDPRDMADIPFFDSEKGQPEFNAGFWGQAMLQGGGFGIFGDFLKSGTSRSQGGFAETLAGPLFQDAQSMVDIATTRNHSGQALKVAKSWLPGGTLWYSRLAFDRMVADQVQELVDPNYRQSWRRMEKWAQEQGSDYWWAPGDVTPERAPDMGNVSKSASLDTLPGAAP